jgi:hypothetical protein
MRAWKYDRDYLDAHAQETDRGTVSVDPDGVSWWQHPETGDWTVHAEPRTLTDEDDAPDDE